MFIAIVNASRRVSDTDAALATRAIHRQIRYHAGPAWAIHAPAVVFMGAVDPASEPAGGGVALPPNVPPGSYAIGLFDTDEVAGALGWHTEGSDGTIFGRVNVGAVLDNHGTVLGGAGDDLSVSSVLSHEALEAFVDPWVNRWAEAGDGSLWALEVGDPVESWGYIVRIDGHDVTVSDFALPAWFDSSSPAGARTHWAADGRELPPFTLAPGGYAITKARGADPVPVWGHDYPQWRKATKGSPLARSARRS